jgi:hypothetical protein
MALHVDCYRIHGDMRGSHLDMDSKCCGVASQPLWADAELIYRR